MRRLLSVLGTLLVVGALSPVAAGHAAAAGSTPQSVAARCGAWSGRTLTAADRQAVRRTRTAADEVFEGQVTLPSRAAARHDLQLRVHVLAIWKGTVQPQTRVTVTFRYGPCRTWTLAHRVHEEYLFFLTRTAAGRLVAAGNEPRIVAHTAALVQELGKASSGTTPPPPLPPVTFTSTGAVAPRPFLKVAAPGIALLIIGVLGLIVVGRLGRRGL